MKIYQSYITLHSLLLAAIVLTVSSCSADNIGNEPSETDDGLVYVSAKISHNLESRSYQAEGVVVDGVYNLTFPTTTNDQYNIGEVRFGVTTENPQIGYVTLPGNQPLKWLTVGGGSTPTLYLDNMARTIDGATTNTTITFTEGNNPYVAAPFDTISGSNDMLWGAKMFQRNAGTINFDLQHAMSRVRLMVTADNTNGEIDLTGATVKITNLNLTPLSFDRLTGTFSLSEDLTAYSELVFVEPENPDLDWINQYEPSDNKVVYQSADFVLPPQDLLQDENRPQLIITLANNGVQYSGILPSAMLIYDDTHDEPSYPVALSFLSQYVLTIRTVVTEDPPSLNFMPVYVMKWVDKGTFEEEAHQSGIYTDTEFYKLIQYYNSGNVFQLDRYGKQRESGETQIWYFDFWHGVTLDYDKIHGMMKVNQTAGPFTFSFNNFTVYVKYNDTDDPVRVTPDDLYKIVTGN